MNGEAISKLVLLFKAGLGLDDAHAVTYNQMIPIPPDEGLFVAVGILDDHPFGGSLSYRGVEQTDPITGTISSELREIQTITGREIFSCQLMSRDNSARKAKRRFAMCLTGTLAEQMMERDGFKIGRLPTNLVDRSITEGAERLNRYVLTVPVFSTEAQESPVEFYDKFPGTPQVITQE